MYASVAVSGRVNHASEPTVFERSIICSSATPFGAAFVLNEYQVGFVRCAQTPVGLQFVRIQSMKRIVEKPFSESTKPFRHWPVQGSS